MRIGVLGTGGMADALATHWVRAGHEVTVGGRDVDKAERLATRIGGGAKPASLRVAAEFGQVVLAALPFDAGVSVARELRAALDGKVLLDCSNPVGPGFRLLTEGGPSAARQLAAAAPGAHVVKAFNLCHEDVWRMRPPVFDGRPLAVPICGDDRAALARVRELVRDVGCAPVAGGGLERAGLLEATAALFIALWVAESADVQAIAPPLAYAAGPGREHAEAGKMADGGRRCRTACGRR
ncbi:MULTISPECIES: NADPH-dependent F420 reductase [Streptomyces]|uniref:NADPH-dependent F420 reductase n=1 Tax=Streptomyces TaxID=1883 RepID=UPI00116287FC|nr:MULTISPECIES: NAD(P)-binding domain-containing protein [unclassified Streptomyces]NMI62851.1 NAD(P)-binding domain-containing protein [Streptomyces sp. RLA2-12]QDN61818.1 NADP oxidoreductase [Streptomyces sp. S1D4-20]QDN71871.1 NADP oxidoreductase [Streptomyces sp. S1D4-14]QDN82175.1 NADP oxidoreductase [Streptomyces sp. S1A1-7]QDO54328.1 NADP oxidoreductase [Streptomyces sp. RLB3-5]